MSKIVDFDNLIVSDSNALQEILYSDISYAIGYMVGTCRSIIHFNELNENYPSNFFISLERPDEKSYEKTWALKVENEDDTKNMTIICIHDIFDVHDKAKVFSEAFLIFYMAWKYPNGFKSKK